MAARRRPSKANTPLDDRQRKLVQEQEELQLKMMQLNRVIEEAPRIVAAKKKAQREELLADRSTRAHHRLNSTTLTDTRFEPFSGGRPSRARRKPLRAEQRQNRLYFCVLLLVLAGLVIWLLSVWRLQWPG